MKVPLISGAYQAKSIIANAQRCVNLYVEKNPQDAPFPTTHYQTPGLVKIAESSDFGWRGLYFASNGTLYGVCGQTFYAIGSDWSLTQLGSVSSIDSMVYMADNGTTLLAVDGTEQGYTVTLADNTFGSVTDLGFYGGTTIQYADGFFILNRPGTTQFYISLAFQATFDATDFAGKTGFADKLLTLAVTRLYIFLLGQWTTEVWVNSGNATFPYQRMPGTFIQHGCAAVDSVAQMDGAIYWLAQSPQGKCMVVHTEQYEAVRISTHAIENEIQSYPRIDDARGYTFQLEGHFQYVLTFPSAQKTWVYDLSTKEWHEWLWLDEQGVFKRHRSNCFAYAYGTPVVGDWENGKLYRLDMDAMTDDGAPISRLRSFPHMVDDGNRVAYREFIADFQVGEGADFEEVPVFLRWSDTRGASWGNHIRESFGLEGDYLKSLQFQRLGMARDRVFELSWSAPVKTALNGAYVQPVAVNQ
ncbi:packaged DNA stabilization protein [Achromobacter aloeverae]|uniref:Bacteriophage P22, Gp10, DNA-stabilising n=1 Tax=Achromobacter aloeverae TaxID=1750518 RepID=A0A4Q1HIH0_9BURK|nr:packaged DNA stabilization protein [Achromobacter aloeverae]RXN88014.1 hypothetical protein C7R54_15675 [Achromobacter aloeverae]